MAYSKGAFADQLGISKKELEQRAKSAGFDTTEAYYNSVGGSAGVQNKQMIDRQKGEEQNFINKFQTAISKQTPLSAIAQRLQQERGLTGARDLATGLTQQALDAEGRLETLPERIGQEVRGFDVNASQRARLEERRANELGRTLSGLSREASRANVNVQALQQDVANQLQLEFAQQQRELLPLQTEGAMISDRLAREMTGYTSAMQNQTSILLAKLQQQGQLDALEMQRLANLATAENEFEYQKKLNEQKFQQQKDYLSYSKSFGGGNINMSTQLTTLDDLVGNLFGE